MMMTTVPGVRYIQTDIARVLRGLSGRSAGLRTYQPLTCVRAGAPNLLVGFKLILQSYPWVQTIRNGAHVRIPSHGTTTGFKLSRLVTEPGIPGIPPPGTVPGMLQCE